MKKNFAIVMVLVILMCIAGGCARTEDKWQEDDSNGQYGGVFKMALTVSPINLDPVHATDESSARIIYQIYENLVQSNVQGEIEPCLAEDWTVSNDGRLYTFKLRKGVKFHHTTEGGIETANGGREVTADDWVWTFNHISDPDTNSERAYYIEMIKGYKEYRDGSSDHIAGVRAKDDYTLEIELEYPFSPFIKMLSHNTFVVLPREDVSKWGDQFGIHPVGTGPFKFEQWDQDDRMMLSKNENYWRKDAQGHKLPYIDGIEFRIVPDLTMQWTEFKQGNFDSIEQVDDPYYKEAKEKYSETFYERPEMGTYFYGMNMSVPPFKGNKPLRQAMNYAIDRQTLIDLLRNGRAVAAKGVLPPGIFGYNSEMEGYTYNPAKAKQLLAEAGYPDGIKVTLYCHTGGDIHRRMAEALQQQYKLVGIDMEIRAVDPYTLMGMIDENKVSMFNLGWSIDYPDPDNFLYVAFHSDNRGMLGNLIRYSNLTVDELTKKARVEIDVEKRREMYQQAESIIVEDAPWVFIYHYTTHQLVQPCVRGYKLPVSGAHTAKYYDIWLDRQE